MPQRDVDCPKCGALITAVVSASRKSIPCPDCGAKIPLKGRRADDEDDDDDRPSRHRRFRDEIEDDDEDDRPRRRKKKRRRAESEGDGPWLVALGASVGALVVTFVLGLLIMGKAGLPAGQDGPVGKFIALCFCVLIGLVLMAIGVAGVKARRAYGRWGYEVTGTMAVILGMVQALGGAVTVGFCLYGLLFMLVRGH
jgi:hypothetical protein